MKNNKFDILKIFKRGLVEIRKLLLIKINIDLITEWAKLTKEKFNHTFYLEFTLNNQKYTIAKLVVDDEEENVDIDDCLYIYDLDEFSIETLQELKTKLRKVINSMQKNIKHKSRQSTIKS